MNVQNDSNGQRSNFTHSFMMNSSYSHPSQDDLTDVLDPIDCDLIFECLGHVNSEMGSEYEPMQSTLPTANNGRSARSPTKKSTRIPSSPKEKSSATPRASRPKSISIAMDPSSSSFSYPQNTTATSQEHSSYDDDEGSMDDCESEKNESSKLSLKNSQLEASKDRRR